MVPVKRAKFNYDLGGDVSDLKLCDIILSHNDQSSCLFWLKKLPHGQRTVRWKTLEEGIRANFAVFKNTQDLRDPERVPNSLTDKGVEGRITKLFERLASDSIDSAQLREKLSQIKALCDSLDVANVNRLNIENEEKQTNEADYELTSRQTIFASLQPGRTPFLETSDLPSSRSNANQNTSSTKNRRNNNKNSADTIGGISGSEIHNATQSLHEMMTILKSSQLSPTITAVTPSSPIVLKNKISIDQVMEKFINNGIVDIATFINYRGLRRDLFSSGGWDETTLSNMIEFQELMKLLLLLHQNSTLFDYLTGNFKMNAREASIVMSIFENHLPSP